MNLEQRRRARDLFEAALEHDPADIVKWLESAAADDSVVRAEVRSLLEHHSRAGSFLTQPVAEAAPHLLEEEHTLEPGTILGTYTVIRELGRGGMGRVYLASDGRLGRTVALKALAPQLTREAHHRERLRREARAAAVLTHPGICTVYALEEFDGELYIVTEFVEGHMLRDEIAGAVRPSIQTIVTTARELASALASAHAKGITHRDLKPENIMRTPEGRIKVLDFGLARIETMPGGLPATLTTPVPGGIVGRPPTCRPSKSKAALPGPRRCVCVRRADVRMDFGPPPIPGRIGARHSRSRARQHARSAVEPCTRAEVAVGCHRAIAPETRERAFQLGRRASAGVRSSGDRRAACAAQQHLVEYTPGRRDRALHIGRRARMANQGMAARASLVMGVCWVGHAGSVGGIIRGHLVFTDIMNRPHLASEIARTQRVRLFTDLCVALLLSIDALLLIASVPLTAVLTMALATGIALAAVLMEPATTVALLGE
jgi:predicted Ser/Thr protein kinase